MHEKNCMRLSSSCKFVFWCLLKILLGKTVEFFQIVCCVVSSKFTIIFSRELLFSYTIISSTLDHTIIARSICGENSSAFFSWKTFKDNLPRSSSLWKIEKQLVWKTNNAAIGRSGEVSIFGHSVRCIKKWTKFCYETSYSTKVSFFFISFSR